MLQGTFVIYFTMLSTYNRFLTKKFYKSEIGFFFFLDVWLGTLLIHILRFLKNICVIFKIILEGILFLFLLGN
jgi:hypothetical protein